MSETSVERKHHIQRMEKTVEDVVGTERRVAAWRQLLKPVSNERVSNEFSLQFSSVIQSCPALCDPMDCSMPGLPVHHQLLELAQTHDRQVSDAIQPSHPLSSPSPPAFNLSQHQGHFPWVSSSHQVAKVLEFQLQSFQWIFRIDFL